MWKWLDNYFYLPEDDVPESHRKFCISTVIAMLIIGVPIIITYWQ
ncbi:hypothetical protein MKX57_17550 [Lysinibacillus sp. FSL M8-0216]|nr:hypothetical protein [Lysinibacillus fusiformis]UXJ67829.1 hypothetical protein N5069_16860 [Lysinibacillus fusiformis]